LILEGEIVIYLPGYMEPKEKKNTIRIFVWASFLNDMGSDMIYPIWPLFVTTVLKTNMAALGFLDGLGEALVSISEQESEKSLSGRATCAEPYPALAMPYREHGSIWSPSESWTERERSEARPATR
jgi:hypothetical protein